MNKNQKIIQMKNKPTTIIANNNKVRLLKTITIMKMCQIKYLKNTWQTINQALKPFLLKEIQQFLNNLNLLYPPKN